MIIVQLNVMHAVQGLVRCVRRGSGNRDGIV